MSLDCFCEGQDYEVAKEDAKKLLLKLDEEFDARSKWICNMTPYEQRVYELTQLSGVGLCRKCAARSNREVRDVRTFNEGNAVDKHVSSNRVIDPKNRFDHPTGSTNQL